jgi:hypothetical protein
MVVCKVSSGIAIFLVVSRAHPASLYVLSSVRLFLVLHALSFDLCSVVGGSALSFGVWPSAADARGLSDAGAGVQSEDGGLVASEDCYLA